MSLQFQNAVCGHTETDDAPCNCRVRDTLEHPPVTTDMTVDEARQEKWAEGQRKYGPVFVGDPLQELYAEFIDALNYFDELGRRGLLSDDLDYCRLTTRRLAELVRREAVKFGSGKT